MSGDEPIVTHPARGVWPYEEAARQWHKRPWVGYQRESGGAGRIRAKVDAVVDAGQGGPPPPGGRRAGGGHLRPARAVLLSRGRAAVALRGRVAAADGPEGRAERVGPSAPGAAGAARRADVVPGGAQGGGEGL